MSKLTDKTGNQTKNLNSLKIIGRQRFVSLSYHGAFATSRNKSSCIINLIDHCICVLVPRLPTGYRNTQNIYAIRFNMCLS